MEALNKEISNRKGQLARAAADAKKAAEEKAKMEEFAAAQTEYDRLYNTYGHMKEEIDHYELLIEDIRIHLETDPENEQAQAQLLELAEERDTLVATYESEAGAFIKAEKILQDLISA